MWLFYPVIIFKVIFTTLCDYCNCGNFFTKVHMQCSSLWYANYAFIILYLSLNIVQYNAINFIEHQNRAISACMRLQIIYLMCVSVELFLWPSIQLPVHVHLHAQHYIINAFSFWCIYHSIHILYIELIYLNYGVHVHICWAWWTWKQTLYF